MTHVLSLYKGLVRLPPTARQIVADVAQRYELTFDDMIGQERTRRIAHPRHHAMWEVRQRTTLSFPQIGRIFDRDHTSVLHDVREHEKRRAAQREAA